MINYLIEYQRICRSFKETPIKLLTPRTPEISAPLFSQAQLGWLLVGKGSSGPWIPGVYLESCTILSQYHQLVVLTPINIPHRNFTVNCRLVQLYIPDIISPMLLIQFIKDLLFRKIKIRSFLILVPCLYVAIFRFRRSHTVTILGKISLICYIYILEFLKKVSQRKIPGNIISKPT